MPPSFSLVWLVIYISVDWRYDFSFAFRAWRLQKVVESSRTWWKKGGPRCNFYIICGQNFIMLELLYTLIALNNNSSLSFYPSVTAKVHSKFTAVNFHFSKFPVKPTFQVIFHRREQSYSPSIAFLCFLIALHFRQSIHTSSSHLIIN